MNMDAKKPSALVLIVIIAASALVGMIGGASIGYYKEQKAAS